MQAVNCPLKYNFNIDMHITGIRYFFLNLTAYGFCDVDDLKTTVRHAVSDRPCPRLSLSVMSVPQCRQGIGGLSHSQLSRKHRARTLSEDRNINSQRAQTRRGHPLPPSVISTSEGSLPRLHHPVTTFFTPLKTLDILLRLHSMAS